MPKLNIKAKIRIGFIVVYLIMLSSSVYLYIQLQYSSHDTELIYEHPFKVTNSTKEIRIGLYKVAGLVRDIDLEVNIQMIDSLNNEIVLNNDNISNNFNIIYEQYLGPKKDVDSAFYSYIEWKSIWHKIVKSVKENKTDSAKYLMLYDFRLQFNKTLAYINVISDFAQQKADTILLDTIKNQNNSMYFSIAFLIISTLLVIFFTIYLSKSITKPIKQFVDEANLLLYTTEKPGTIVHHDEQVLLFTLDKLKKAYQSIEQQSREIKTINQQLSDLNLDLEDRVKERTAKLKATNEKLNILMCKLELSNKELEQFAYVASHDLQEPLRMISSYTQLLERRYKDKLDDDANEFIHFAVDGANRMQKLINDLLDYSRVTMRGKEFVTVDISSVLAQVVANLYQLITENTALITTENSPVVMADESQIERVFQNLIENAIKYKKKTELPMINISCKKQDEFYEFAVRDNGIGIDMQYHDRVFIIFQRLHSKEEYAGTGIGLAICKRIIERHDGKIWFESKLGEGTTFYFTLKA